MTDIAQQAGVSRATVSVVLNQRSSGTTRISPLTRQRVLEAAEALGYHPNELARSVARGQSRMIGYLVREPNYEPYWNTIIGALREAEAHGFTLKVFSVTPSTCIRRIQQCIELRLSGLIVRLDQDKPFLLDEAMKANIPVVLVDESVDSPFSTRVAANDEPGCREALDHLVRFGHQKIGFITSGFSRRIPGHLDIGSTRETLFRDIMASHRLTVPEGYVVGEATQVFGPDIRETFDPTPAVEATQALLNHPAGRPTAIMCWRDEAALVAANTCRLHGLRVPEDISIIGFSDLGAARYTSPPLSTVRSPWIDMGRSAVQQLIGRLDASSQKARGSVLIPTQFVPRQSSGPAPQLSNTPA